MHPAFVAMLLLLSASCASSKELPRVPLTPPPRPTTAQNAVETWGEDLRADDVRRATGGPAFGSEDVALAVPRVVFFVPARVIEFGSLPLRGGLRFTQEHHVVEHVGGIFSGGEGDAPPPAPRVGASKAP